MNRKMWLGSRFVTKHIWPFFTLPQYVCTYFSRVVTRKRIRELYGIELEFLRNDFF